MENVEHNIRIVDNDTLKRDDILFGKQMSANKKLKSYIESKPLVNIFIVPVLMIFSIPIITLPIGALGWYLTDGIIGWIPYILSSIMLFFYSMYHNYKFETRDLMEYEKLIGISNNNLVILEPEETQNAYQVRESLGIDNMRNLKRLDGRTKFVFEDSTVVADVPIEKIQEIIYKV